jgi:hypothetical protein
MPEPRLILMGGEILIGYRNSHREAFSEYGHKPWQKGYKDAARERRETAALYRFQAEWAVLRGAQPHGTSVIALVIYRRFRCASLRISSVPNPEGLGRLSDKSREEIDRQTARSMCGRQRSFGARCIARQHGRCEIRHDAHHRPARSQGCHRARGHQG